MVKKTREFHDKKSENISGESTGVRHSLTFLSQMRRLIEGSAYSSEYSSYYCQKECPICVWIDQAQIHRAHYSIPFSILQAIPLIL